MTYVLICAALSRARARLSRAGHALATGLGEGSAIVMGRAYRGRGR
uniref:Uncharacterized protein n=1 Tax=Dulem virus 38 TaxID=3145756 RepID=A0AAU8B0F3_9CAUD